MLVALRGLLRAKFATAVMVVDEASLLDAAARMEPDLVIVDLSLPVAGNINAVRSVCGQHPGLRVIVLSVHDEPAALAQALGAGAAGYVLKRTAATDLVEAVDTVLRGGIYVPAALGLRPDEGKSG
jgi:DNA-binding NarL/FixJ family response regulator